MMDKTDEIIWQCIDKLKKIRDGQGLSQDALAEMARLSHSTISMAETYRNSPTLKTLIKMCDAMDVKLSDLLKDIDK